MRCAHEYDTVDLAAQRLVSVTSLVRYHESFFHDYTTQAMADEDNWPFGTCELSSGCHETLEQNT